MNQGQDNGSALDTLSGVIVSSNAFSRRPSRKTRPEVQAQRSFWLWAFLWTALWHLAWLFFPVPSNVPDVTRKVDVVPLVYMAPGDPSGQGRGRLQDILKAKSPALFAMPRTEGFSSRFFQRRSSFRPPVKNAAAPAWFYEESFVETGEPDKQIEERLHVAAAQRLGQVPRPSDEPAFKSRAADAAGQGLVVSWNGSVMQQDLVAGFPGSPSGVEGRWKAVAWVQLDGAGRAIRAVLRNRTEDNDWNHAFVRWLHGQTIPGTSGENAGLITVEGWPEEEGGS